MANNNIPFDNCEQYVLAMLDDAQQKNKFLNTEVDRLKQSAQFSESVLNLLKQYVAMDPITGLIYCNLIIPAGPVRDALANTFTKRITVEQKGEETKVTEIQKPERKIPKNPNSGKSRKKIIPMKPIANTKKVTNNDELNKTIETQVTPVEQELSEQTQKVHKESEPIYENSYEEIK